MKKMLTLLAIAFVCTLVLVSPALAVSEKQAKAIAKNAVMGKVVGVEDTSVLHRGKLIPVTLVVMDVGLSSYKMIYIADNGTIIKKASLLRGRYYA